MARTIAIAFGLLLLTACTSTEKMWFRPGATQNEMTRDLADCKYRAAMGANPLAMANLGFALADKSRREDIIENCMIAKGYVLTDPKQVHWAEASNAVSSEATGGNLEAEKNILGMWQSTEIVQTGAIEPVDRITMIFERENKLSFVTPTDSSNRAPVRNAYWEIRGKALLVSETGTAPYQRIGFSINGDSLILNDPESGVIRLKRVSAAE